MSQIKKHSFEAVSLLTTSKGVLDVTIIPAMNQPDWIVPSSLILGVEAHEERIWTHIWNQQEVSVFHLLPSDEPVDKLVILEGNTVVHRLALQTRGELQQLQVRISDVKDTELPEEDLDIAISNIDWNLIEEGNFNIHHPTTESKYFTNSNIVEERVKENVVISYMFQTVMINDVAYLVPDLDKIAHQLVDLDR